MTKPYALQLQATLRDSHHMIPIGCWWARGLFGSESLPLSAAAPIGHLTHPADVLVHPWALICVQLAHTHLDARVTRHVSPSGVQLLLQGNISLFVLCALWLGSGCREVLLLWLAGAALRLRRLKHHSRLWTTDCGLNAGWDFGRILRVRWRRGGRVAYYFLIVRQLAVCPEALNGKKRKPGQIPKATEADANIISKPRKDRILFIWVSIKLLSKSIPCENKSVMWHAPSGKQSKLPLRYLNFRLAFILKPF